MNEAIARLSSGIRSMYYGRRWSICSASARAEGKSALMAARNTEDGISALGEAALELEFQIEELFVLMLTTDD